MYNNGKIIVHNEYTVRIRHHCEERACILQQGNLIVIIIYTRKLSE